MQSLHHPVNSLKPRKLQNTGSIAQLRHQAFAMSNTHCFITYQSTRHLNIIRLWIDLTNLIQFGFINMPVRIMFQQIPKRKDLQFLLQQIRTQRPYPFQVFDGRK